MYENLDIAIKEIFGSNTRIEAQQAVSGGDINDAYHIVLSSGEDVFLKRNEYAKEDFFAAEAAGLAALSKSGASTPSVIAYGNLKTGGAFLLLEYVRSMSPKSGYWEALGHMLANMHRAPTGAFVQGGSYGLNSNNYIGQTRQANMPSDSWLDFFRTARLGAQMKLASHHFDASDRKHCQYLLDHLEEFLPEPEFPSLIHGDLWGGNVMPDSNGNPMLIDPAVYVGHHEADIAMTELFGRFSPAFYDAYYEVIPRESSYADRRDLYNLYHLLNHLNLFGISYLSSVRRIIKRYAA